MRTFRCICGNTLHFENSQCLSCGRTVGFLPDSTALVALEHREVEDGELAGPCRIAGSDQVVRLCRNGAEHNVCNWLVASEPGSDPGSDYCTSCALNHIIPNLAEPRNLTLWFRMEQAKRRLLYTLLQLRLPIVGRRQDPVSGLGFEFLQDEITAEGFNHELTVRTTVITGHASGMITLNLSEAEPSAREEMREQMNERYRTLLGHFRHESGHYYWDRLIRGTRLISTFRSLFGDERQDYQQALSRHYQAGPPDHWEECWISAYASAHPWEDWAETWAHYLHMVDTLETAFDFGFHVEGAKIANPEPSKRDFIPFYGPGSFNALIADWSRMTTALNALNRSMGMEDAYPFVIADASLEKLRFVHRVVRGGAHDGSP